jgi:hypothetical protein
MDAKRRGSVLTTVEFIIRFMEQKVKAGRIPERRREEESNSAENHHGKDSWTKASTPSSTIKASFPGRQPNAGTGVSKICKVDIAGT